MTLLRWRKLARDVWLARGRILSMIAAIAVSVAAVAAFLTARAVIGAEITGNYLAQNPASATLHVPTGVTKADVAAALAQPGVVGAVARGTVLTRVKVAAGSWQPLLLFVSAIDDPQTISTVTVEHGTWPPPASGVFLERTALPFLGVQVGQQVRVRAAGGPEVSMTVAGSVHDAGVAPASQERTAYGHVTTSALTELGQSQLLNELKIVVGDASGPSADSAVIATTAQGVAAKLAALGSPVTGIDIPPPLRHPHYGQMLTVSLVLMTFSVIALLLSSILVATMLGGLLTAQIRQIGAMKAVGARTGQILAMYLSLTAAIAAVATALALYPGFALGELLAEQAAGLLNLDITSPGAPTWVVVVVLSAGLVVPVLVALFPLLRAARRTVREAIDEHGREPGRIAEAVGSRLSRLPGVGRTQVMAARALMTRPGRLVLTVGLLAVAGAAFLTGLNTATGWDALAQQGVVNRHYDLEVRLASPADAKPLLAAASGVEGVVTAEAWNRAAIAVTNPGLVDVAHVYPDDSHGSFTVMAPPAGTPLITLPLQSGRWLNQDDRGSIVLNTLALAAQVPGTRVGDTITLTMDGRATSWKVVGIVSDFGTQAAAYVTDTEYAAASGTIGKASMIRVVTDATDAAGRRAVLDRLESTFGSAGFAVETAFATDDLRSALDGHVFVLIEALLAIAILIGFVGLLGLGSAVSTSVTERTREFAVMAAIGASPQAIRRIVSTEGILTGIVGLVIAVIAAIPLTAAFGDFLGNTAFRQPLPVTITIEPLLIWAALTLSGALLATRAAAGRAARLTVREALTVL
jgi:putative ABC transport system permease protein